MPLESEPGDLRGQGVTELAGPDDDEPRVRNFRHDARRGVEQVLLALVRHQRRDVADDRRAVRQPELPVHVERRELGNAFDVDALVDDDGPSRRDAVVDQHAANRVGRAQEAVHPPVFPARQRIAADVKVDAPRRREKRAAPAGERDGRRGQGQRVRIVCVHDVRSEPAQEPGQPPRGAQIQLAGRGQGNEIRPAGRAAVQLTPRVGDERGPLAGGAQAGDGQANLLLAPAPGPGRIDMQGEHSYRRSGVPCSAARCCSSASRT